jgi:hypothetical protein
MRVIRKEANFTHPETFQSIMIVTLEIPLEPMQDALASLTDEQLERHIGREFLKALEDHNNLMKNKATDVVFKEEKQDGTTGISASDGTDSAGEPAGRSGSEIGDDASSESGNPDPVAAT